MRKEDKGKILSSAKKMSIKNKQVFFTSFIIFLCFVFFYYVYPNYVQKIELDKQSHKAEKNSKLILNSARIALEQNNFKEFYEFTFPLTSTANLSYLLIFDSKGKQVFQLNNKDNRIQSNLHPDNRITVKDSLVHVVLPIMAVNDSLLGTLQAGFDVYEVYNAFKENQLQALAILVFLLLIIILLAIIFNRKSIRNSNNSNHMQPKIADVERETRTKSETDQAHEKVEIALPFAPASPENFEESHGDKLAGLVEKLSEKLDVLESDLKSIIKKDGSEEDNISHAKVRQEFEFIVKLYKVSNNYRKIAGANSILKKICPDVCEEFMYDLALLYRVEDDDLTIFDSYTRGMPTLTEKYLKKCKNRTVKKKEIIYKILKDKEPVFARQLPNCEVLQEMEIDGHYAFLPIMSNDHIWAILAVGLLGKGMKVELRDVEKMLFYCNTVGTYLESVKNFETLGSNLKIKTRELVKANTLLRRSIREKDEFLRAISHDLIAPLRNISGLINSIERIYSDKLEHGLEDRLFRIRRNVEKDMELVNEILEISRVKSRKLVIEKVDLNQLILNIFENFNHELYQKKIKIKIQEKFPVIYFDKFIINQILQNLVDNAIKYIKPTSKIRTISLNWRYVHNKVAFAISDTGIGIPADDLDKIFSIFYRSKNELNVGSEGKGVGLAMIKSLLEKFNGEIWVKSKVGAGSIFYFTFPDSVLRPPEIKKT